MTRALTLASALALLLAAGAVGLWPLLLLLHANWTAWYGPSEHGYLVLALAAWMAVRHWRAAPPAQLAPAWWGAGGLLLVLAALAALELLFINSTRLTLLPLFALTAVLLVFGRSAALRLFWPAAFLYFALPQWWAINSVLQSLTTAIVTRLVAWTGIPAFIEGNFVHIPAGVFEIASGCSGLNYVVVGLALAAFYALMYLRQWRHWLQLLLIAGVLSLVSNWVRVYLLILVGHLSDMQHYLITVEHHLFGWALFLVFMIPMLLAARRLEERELRSLPAPEPTTPEPIAPESTTPQPPAPRPTVSPTVVPAALLAAVLLLIPRAFTAGESPGVQPSLPLPATLGGWVTAPAGEHDWRPRYVNASDDQVSVRLPSGAVVEVYRGVYVRQDTEHRLVRGDNDPLGPGFRLADTRRVEDIGDGRVPAALEFRGTLAGRERLVWRYHLAGGIPAVGALETKLAELRGVLAGRRDGVVIAVSTECRPDCAAARAALSRLLAAAADELHQLPQPGDTVITQTGGEP